MGNLESTCARLAAASLPIDVWVDGSFLTEKLDPRDVDVVARIPARVYNSNSQTTRDTLAWFRDDARRDDLSLDAYEFRDFPQNSSMYPMTHSRVEYWTDFFGNSRSGRYTKGIAVVQICGGVR